jgi:hypothetical protein
VQRRRTVELSFPGAGGGTSSPFARFESEGLIPPPSEDTVMQSPQDFRSAPPEFHPEFGYFWPAAQTRRIARIGLAATACGALFGAIAVLAMTPHPDPDAVRIESALTVTPLESPAPTVASNPTPVVAAAATPTIAAPEPAVPAKPCKEQTWPYLDGKCTNGTPIKQDQVRVLRPEAPAQSAPALVVPATPSDVTAAAQLPETPAAKSKKAQKVAQSRQRKRRGYDDMAEADPRSRYGDPRSAYAAPSGGRYEQPPARRDWGWGW